MPSAGSGSSPAIQIPAEQPTFAEVLRRLNELSGQLDDAHRQIEQLQLEVGRLRQQLSSAGDNAASVDSLKQAVQQVKDEQEMNHAQVATLEQTKVESSSRYPVSISGLVLFNGYVVDGSVDNPVLPLIALYRGSTYPHHSLGATLNQTQIGLNMTGPTVWNARTSAQLQADFFPSLSYSSPAPASYAAFRLRTGQVDLNWQHTQATAGLEAPLISPLSPTSLAMVAEPSLAWAGNLWTWLPQLTVEQTMAMPRGARLQLGFGALDPESGDVTGEASYGIQRRNLQPGYEARAAWQWGLSSRPYGLGANGYYTRQLFYGSQKLDFWAAAADWRLPLARPLDLSGEFYRGQGVGDLGGGAFKNIVTAYDTGLTRALDATGGWTQLSARIGPTAQINGFFGIDSAWANQVREAKPVITTSPYLYLIRNQSFGGNFILRPRTYLVFSAEYRGLRSWYTYGPARAAQNLTLSTGYIF